MWKHISTVERETGVYATVAKLCLHVAVALLILLLVGVGGYGFSIHTGAVRPPVFNAQLGTFWVTGYTTNDPACPAFMPCPAEVLQRLPQSYYVVWIRAPRGWPRSEEWDIDQEFGIRVLTLSLSRRL
jgi:hypothetical protein